MISRDYELKYYGCSNEHNNNNVLKTVYHYQKE